jgi:hypothetical protein
LIDELRARQDITGTARYNYALGMPDEWHFAWIAIDDSNVSSHVLGVKLRPYGAPVLRRVSKRELGVTHGA